jgi:phosphate-selective porin OprO/OprP
MKCNLKTAVKVVLLSGGAMMASNATAHDKELLDILLGNGSINQAQYNQLIKKETLTKDDVIVKLNKKGLQFATADKQFKMKIGARLHVDAVAHSGGDNIIDDNASNGTEIRRARIYLKGTVWNDFKYVTEVDFADNASTVKDMSMTYTGFDGLEITAGHQKQNISMELQESSNDIMFTERSLINTITGIAFDRALGLHLKAKGKDWSAQLGLYGESVGKSDKTGGDEGWGMSTRLTYTPINTKTQVLHVGGYAGFRDVSDNGDLLNGGKGTALKYETAHMSNLHLLDTGSIANLNKLSMYGLEAAYMQGPFSVQTEYTISDASRGGGSSDEDFSAYYVQAGWTLTGESRSYKGSDGEFKRLKPAHKFSPGADGGWGAWELAARYDHADMNSGDIRGGEETAITIALNWYLNENVRIMADYRRAIDVDPRANLETGGNYGLTANSSSDLEDIDTFTLRGQWAF